MSMPPMPIELVRVVQNGLYWQVAATTAVLYDHVTTLDLEVELVWRRKWTFVQVLFVVNRYLGDALFVHGATQAWFSGEILEAMSVHFPFSMRRISNKNPGPSGVHIQTWLGMITLWAMHGIVINRIMCMYNYARGVTALLLSFFFIQAGYGLIVAVLSIERPSSMVTLAPNFRICAPVNTADWFWPFLFFMGVFDLLILLLSLLESIRFFFASYQLVAKGSLVPKFSSTGWKSQTHIFQIFLRDSVLFPFLGFATCIVSLLAWLRIVKPSAIQITIILTTMAPPILGCRLILNLREAYYKPFEDECRTALIFADLPSSTQSQPPSPGISSLTPVSTNDSNC